MAAVAKAAQWAPRWRVVQHPNMNAPRLPSALQAARRESPCFNIKSPVNLWAKPSRHFSIHQKPSRQQGDKAPAGEHGGHSNGTELPAFSLHGLGISRNMKLALVGILGIFGAMETWMYCKWIWQWCKGQADDEQTSKPVMGR
ncbi:hypothetical protein X797_010519 [Metarhizium robertsii]|uniref:Uncharacterized protein n=2 Tax=Metarhizium robertsii TaxID=568076 RepID=E9FBB0_METRA|nr:uncharacterized protein MAA_09559 [Metarhizium robertsii ARSEF 23]EFY94981.1 hypothetical protein MAA_09559 [Metarhizium robertsii ARSEF 23]EXU96401.1 hypothetical protein X797_010519 [Metarhizium robertsii]